MNASSAGPVACAGLIQHKNREESRIDELQVLGNRSFHRPVDRDPGGIQSGQSSCPYSPHHDGVHPPPAEGLKGLALTVLMFAVSVVYGFKRALIPVYKDEAAG